MFADDKFKLVELCLNSFVRAFQDVNPTCAFILDGCDDRYYELVGSVPFNKSIHRCDLAGNLGTHHLRLDLAADAGDKVVILDEDYYWLDGAGKDLNYALDVFDFAAFYDHPDYYCAPWNTYQYRMCVVGDRHWRRSHFTTLSFASHSRCIKKYWMEFHRHMDKDWELWQDLRERGVELWSPVPSLSTHMAEGFLSPGIKWKEDKLWQNELRRN